LSARITGAMAIMILSWACVDFVSQDDTLSQSLGRFAPAETVRTWGLCLTCVGAGACGAIMALAPRWWCDRYFARGRDPVGAPGLILAIRMMGVVLVAVALFLWAALG
jgi:hypothetical protein